MREPANLDSTWTLICNTAFFVLGLKRAPMALLPFFCERMYQYNAVRRDLDAVSSATNGAGKMGKSACAD